MTMTYEDQVGIGANITEAVRRELANSGWQEDELANMTAAVARAVLVQLDQAGYKIERK
jgi:hypothetical protein